MGEVFNKTKYYEKYLGGDMVEDVAIYFSFNSRFDPFEKGIAQFNWLNKDSYPHQKSILGAANTLIESHIPFGVITKKNLDKLTNYKILILSNVISVDEEEFNNIYSFVKNGGLLYASGIIPEMVLNDIFKLEYLGITKENITYITPTAKGFKLIEDIDEDNPLVIRDHQVLVKSKEYKDVLAKLVLPYTDPNDISKFASIHSNPPGIKTDFASIVCKKVKSGKAIYVSGPLEKFNEVPHKKTFINIIKYLYPKGFSLISEAPYSVEITVFSQKKKKRFILNIVNMQEKFPAIPVYDFKVKLKVLNKEIYKVVSLTYKEDLKFLKMKDYIEINIPKLELFNMILVKYN